MRSNDNYLTLKSYEYRIEIPTTFHPSTRNATCRLACNHHGRQPFHNMATASMRSKRWNLRALCSKDERLKFDGPSWWTLLCTTSQHQSLGRWLADRGDASWRPPRINTSHAHSKTKQTGTRSAISLTPSKIILKSSPFNSRKIWTYCTF